MVKNFNKGLIMARVPTRLTALLTKLMEVSTLHDKKCPAWVDELIAEVSLLQSMQQQVDDELVCCWIVAKNNDYRTALHMLVGWNIDVEKYFSKK